MREGTRLGAYEIIGSVGAGGMGEVYRARDPRLGRDVAIKVIAEQFSERFERESRSIAALNHPNICQIYDVGHNYLVMEFVDGSRIAQPDSPRKLLDLAVQIADGLAAAHAAGVIHRDLKPDNIFVAGPASATPGRVKILDFGLAKPATTSTADRGSSPTRVSTLTDPGSAVGTVYYMSPEQARGDSNLSAQSDQFSLGLVLYELAAGRRAFQRSSAPEVLTAIIREDPEPLPATTPAPLRWVIERLLSKDPADRYDSTRDLYRELRQIRDRASEATTSAMQAVPVASPNRRRDILILAVAVAALAAVAAMTLVLLPPPAVDLGALKFTPLSRMDATERDPAWSQDGSSIVFTASVRGIDQVFTKAIDSPAPSNEAQITNARFPCIQPFWSHDGSRIFYQSENKLWSIPASGGTPVVALDNAARVLMHPDGRTVLFLRGGKLWLDVLGSRQPREFGQAGLVDETVRITPFSPDGSKVLVATRQEQIVIEYPSGAVTKAFPNQTPFGGSRSWLPDSRHVIEIEADPATFNSSLLLLDTQNGSRRRLYTAGEFINHLAVSPNGRRMAYVRGLVEWNALEIALPSGSVRTALGGSGMVSWWPDWARAGTHFLVCTNRSGPFAIEDVSLSESFSRRLYTSEPGELVTNGRWAPDGARFAFIAGLASTNPAQLRVANLSGSRPITIAENVRAAAGMSWSPDGQWIAYLQPNPPGVAKIRADSRMPPVILAQLSVEDRPGWGSYEQAEWSPDGKWIAYPTAQGITLVAPDSKTTRLLTTRKLRVFGFSNDANRMFGIERESAGKGPQWQLYQIDVTSGAEKLLGAVDLPASVDALAGFSMHPDGTRFLISIAKWPLDIWMIEGINPTKSRLARLLGR